MKKGWEGREYEERHWGCDSKAGAKPAKPLTMHGLRHRHFSSENLQQQITPIMQRTMKSWAKERPWEGLWTRTGLFPNMWIRFDVGWLKEGSTLVGSGG